MSICQSRSTLVCVGLLFFLARPAAAQFARPWSGTPIGETYHVELFGGLWNPSPTVIVSSESLGIPGTDIDFVSDLGIAKTRFKELRLVLRPATKHRFRLQYIPMRYEADTILNRRLVFNGQEYRIGVPVTSTLEWKAWRFGYEYDFIYRNRGFAGFIVEAKYTNVSVDLQTPIVAEFARARAPIPAIGGIGRFYVVPNISITGELTGLKLTIDPENHGSYFDFDLYGTLNFTNNFGAEIGYRSLDVNYRVDEDAGDFRLKGIYFAGVVRY